MGLDMLKVEQFLSANKNLSDDKINATETLLAAINEWPNSALTIEEYESQVEKFIGGPVTKERIQATLKNIDHSRNAWQAESLTQLVTVFKFFNEGIDLNEIIKVISALLGYQGDR